MHRMYNIMTNVVGISEIFIEANSFSLCPLLLIVLSKFVPRIPSIGIFPFFLFTKGDNFKQEIIALR